MHLIVVDIQGFNIPEFVVKELTILDGRTTVHHIFKPSKPFSALDDKSRKCVRYLEQHHHMLTYQSGTKNQEEVEVILKKFVRTRAVDVIYVKGLIKENYIRETLGGMCVKIINLENVATAPTFCKELPICNNHCNNFTLDRKCICSHNNARKLYDWLYKSIPQ